MRNRGPILNQTDSLVEGDYLESPNRLFHAVMQSDGNFVVYCYVDSLGLSKPLFNSATPHFGRGASATLRYWSFQGRKKLGLLVSNHNGSDVDWALMSQFEGEFPSAYLAMQDDGNLCINTDTRSIAASDTVTSAVDLVIPGSVLLKVRTGELAISGDKTLINTTPDVIAVSDGSNTRVIPPNQMTPILSATAGSIAVSGAYYEPAVGETRLQSADAFRVETFDSSKTIIRVRKDSSFGVLPANAYSLVGEP